MRFRAPARSEIDPTCFAQPVYAGYRRHLDLLTGADWPALATLNQRMAVVDPGIAFVEQNADLLADGRHYEQRIATQGRVATRRANWHDLFNALIWIEHVALKRALNARQVADIARLGARERSRGQYALTHFDEAGVVVVLRNTAVLPAWQSHDWVEVFVDHQVSWRKDIDLVVFGHALLEHALRPGSSLVGKCVVIEAGAEPIDACLDWLARQIIAGAVLNDPQELRPLPMLGLPDWHEHAGDPDFHREHPSFQPLRPGRCYPSALRLPGMRADAANIETERYRIT